MTKQLLLVALIVSCVIAQNNTTISNQSNSSSAMNTSTNASLNCNSRQYIAVNPQTNQNYCDNCGIGAQSCTQFNVFTSCQAGWFSTPLPNNSVSCQQCYQENPQINSVHTCQNGINALTCTNGYQLYNNQCVSCQSSTSSACPSTCEGYGFYTLNNTCRSCSDTMNKCHDKCLTQGYFTNLTLQNGIATNHSCIRCQPQLYQNLSSYGQPQKCLSCPPGTQDCAAVSFTTQCRPGQYLTNNQCLNCQANNATSCESCVSFGFFSPNSTSCRNCLTNTSACNTTCLSNGYFTNGTTCSACPSYLNALNCNIVGGVIVPTYCQNGFALRENVCQQCADPQGNCSSILSVFSCKTGYYNNKNNNNCAQSTSCSSDSAVCSNSCANNGYFTDITGQTQKCSKCTNPGVLNCLNNQVATQCDVGHLLSEGKCYKCGDNANCAQTISNVQIDQCQSGYVKNANVCQKCQDVNALTCNSTETSQNKISLSCKSNYFLSSGVCVQCQDVNALTCNTTDVLADWQSLTCKNNYFLRTNGTSKSCIKCRDPNAHTCDDELANNTIKSLTCNDGYVKFNINASSSNCSKCLDNNTNTCNSIQLNQSYICKPGYVLNSTNICQKCNDNNATSCDSSLKSLTCNNGYVLVGNTCTKCTDLNALTCSAQNQALTLSCMTGNFLNETSGLCVNINSTIEFASSIQKTYKIQSCVSGYYLSSNACVICPQQNANTCNLTNVLTCVSGYFLSGANCVQCLNGGDKCDNNTQTSFTQCATGYYLTGTTCTACSSKFDANIQSCGYIDTQLACSNTKYLSNGACINCESNSQLCSASCLQTGYFNNGTSSCGKCAEGTLSCQSANISLTCDKGYYLNYQYQCAKCADGNATSCSALNNVIPINCKPGYSLLGGQCVQCPANFLSCSSNTIGLQCLPGFYKANNDCLRCSEIAQECISPTFILKCASGYFATPVSGNQVTCTQCPQGGLATACYNATYALACKSSYFAFNGDCLSCPDGAANCSSQGIATQCQPGYFMNSTKNECQLCGANAHSCINNTQATVCFAQYGLQGGQCNQCNYNTKTCIFNNNFSGSNSTSCLAGFILNQLNANSTCACPLGQVQILYTCKTYQSNDTSNSTNVPTQLTCPSGQYIYTYPTNSSTATNTTQNAQTNSNNNTNTSTQNTSTTNTSATNSTNQNNSTNSTNSSNSANQSVANNTNTSNNASNSSNTSANTSSNQTNQTKSRILQAQVCRNCSLNCLSCTSGTLCTRCVANYSLSAGACVKQTIDGFKLQNGNIFLFLFAFMALIQFLKY